MESESTLGHLTYGLFLCPPLNRDAVKSAHGASTIRAMLTMNQHGGPFRVRDNLKETDCVLLLRMPGFHVDMLVSQSGATDLVTIGVEGAEVDDRFYSNLLQISHALGRGLCTAVENFAYLMKVRHPIECDGLSP